MIGRFIVAALLASSSALAQVGPVCPAGSNYAACSRAAVQASIASSQSSQKLARERAEAADLGRTLLAESQHPEWRQKMSDAALAGYVATVRTREARINAILADLGKEPSDPTAFGDVAAAEVAKEQACRADSKCMIDRQAQALTRSICADVSAIRTLQQRIQVEKANPSGVVDLADLHSSGEDIQIHQASVDAGKAAYVKVTKKTFDVAVCR